MRRLLFDKLPVLHPAFFPDMAARTGTAGSASEKLRMRGRRFGWIVGPEKLNTGYGPSVGGEGCCSDRRRRLFRCLRQPFPRLSMNCSWERSLHERTLKGCPLVSEMEVDPCIDTPGWRGDATPDHMPGWGTHEGAQCLRSAFSKGRRARLTTSGTWCGRCCCKRRRQGYLFIDLLSKQSVPTF